MFSAVRYKRNIKYIKKIKNFFKKGIDFWFAACYNEVEDKKGTEKTGNNRKGRVSMILIRAVILAGVLA